MNMTKQSIVKISEKIARPLQAIGSAQRIAILLAIGEGEACVCHLEAALGWRQAYISQHLMSLRKAGILTDRREGRYVFYWLQNPKYLELIKMAAALSEADGKEVALPINTHPYPACACPQCAPSLITIEEALGQ
jgi:ArsR family transcriptional regulator